MSHLANLTKDWPVFGKQLALHLRIPMPGFLLYSPEMSQNARAWSSYPCRCTRLQPRCTAACAGLQGGGGVLPPVPPMGCWAANESFEQLSEICLRIFNLRRAETVRTLPRSNTDTRAFSDRTRSCPSLRRTPTARLPS